MELAEHTFQPPVVKPRLCPSTQRQREHLWTHWPRYRPRIVLWTGSPPSSPVLQTRFIRGQWFCGLCSPAPQRFSCSSPVIIGPRDTFSATLIQRKPNYCKWASPSRSSTQTILTQQYFLHESGSEDTPEYATVTTLASLTVHCTQETIIFLDLGIPSPVEPCR